MAETPAALAIRLIGAKRIAAACDLTTDAVWKWPKHGGTIPAAHQPRLYRLAREIGVELSAAQIIGVSEGVGLGELHATGHGASGRSVGAALHESCGGTCDETSGAAHRNIPESIR